MKPLRIALASLILLGFFLIAPAVALPSITLTWQGFAYHGFDPYYDTTITGFKAGSAATLTLTIVNTYDAYIDVTGAKLMFDWNVNYTASATVASPMRINQKAVLPVTFAVSIPATTVASNLVPHSYSWYINFTGPTSGTHNLFTPPGPTEFPLYVLSSDQADTLAAALQLPQPLTGSPYGYCGVSIFGTSTGFKTAEAATLCQQSQQQANLGVNLYSVADFADAKTSFQTAANDWNQALSTDRSMGGNLEIGQTLQGWGFFLLGIGAVIASVGGTLYSVRRLREHRGMTATTTATR